MRWAKHVAGKGRKTSTQGYARKCEGRGPHGRPTQRWKDNFKTNLKTESIEGHTLDSSIRGQVVGFCEYSNELLGSKKCAQPLD